MLKKMLLLSSMALAVVVLAAPAVAQAEWTHEGTPAEEEVELDLAGEVQFDVPSLGSSFRCDAVRMKIGEGLLTHAVVTQYEPTTDTCSGAGPVFFNCELTGDTATTLPWTATIFGSVIRVQDFTVDSSYENCISGIPGSALKFSEVTLTPDSPEAIGTFTLSGEQAGVKFTGHFEVANAPETYGIE